MSVPVRTTIGMFRVLEACLQFLVDVEATQSRQEQIEDDHLRNLLLDES
jgi:hypothetical protein